MRYTQSEKYETIRLVEGSQLPVKQTLRELDIPSSTFYDWYGRTMRMVLMDLQMRNLTPSGSGIVSLTKNEKESKISL